MKAFADLYSQLDASTSHSSKLEALQRYLAAADESDAAWAVFFLAGGKPRQRIATKVLRQLISQREALPDWLFDECYQAVGDLAETISLLLPRVAHRSDEGLAAWVEKLRGLSGLMPEQIPAQLIALLEQLDQTSQLVLIKLITGSFRVGVSKLSVIRALAAVSGCDAKRIAQRMVGYTDAASAPSANSYRRLIAPASDDVSDDREPGQPYPFFLAHPLATVSAQSPEAMEQLLGPALDWQVEWKWDGIRAQLVKRRGQLWLWSRGEELITDQFPEFQRLLAQLADGTVIDGELVVWTHDQVQAFAQLQQRLGRKSVSAALQAKIPVVLLAYDLLEWQGEDCRGKPQLERRRKLESEVAEIAQPCLRLSPLVVGASWSALAEQRERSRALGVEGLMLKHRQSSYGVGRTKSDGVWWKWKIEPFTVDAVLIYAQKGHGRRASLYTDFTFAVWDGEVAESERKLVPFAKAYSGLTDEQMRQVDAVIQKTTIEKFGPVRSVKPSLVFELGFEGIARSARHKSGIAVRFPRILRWRQDKTVAQADTLQNLQALLPQAVNTISEQRT